MFARYLTLNRKELGDRSEAAKRMAITVLMIVQKHGLKMLA
jgi:hypothetical protein